MPERSQFITDLQTIAKKVEEKYKMEDTKFRSASLRTKIIRNTIGVATSISLAGCAWLGAGKPTIDVNANDNNNGNTTELTPPPNAIEQQRLTGKPVGVYNYNNPASLYSQEELDSVEKVYGSKINTVRVYVALDKGPVESVKLTGGSSDDMLTFTEYILANGRREVVFPDGKEDYNNATAHKAEFGWTETSDGKIHFTSFYRDPQNDQNITSFLSIDWSNSSNIPLENIASDPNALTNLGTPDTLTITNPHANEEIVYKVSGEGNTYSNDLISFIGNVIQPETIAHAQVPSQTPTPEATATATPTETPAIYTPDQLAQMTPDQILAAAPSETGFTKKMSEVKTGIVKYYNDKGELDHVYDLLTGAKETPEQAGIKEFDMTTGGKWEVAAFYGENGQPMTAADMQKAFDYMRSAGAHESTMQQQYNKNLRPFYENLAFKAIGVPGYAKGWEGISDSFGIAVNELSNQKETIVVFEDANGDFQAIVIGTTKTQFMSVANSGF